MASGEPYAAVYALVQAHKGDHFICTSSGAESVNHVVWATYLDVTRTTGRNHFVSSCLDEAPAILSMSRLAALDCVHEMVPVNQEGILTPRALGERLTSRTALVSLSWANGLTGVIQPVGEISALCQERGIALHVEATHVLGRGYDTLEGSGADFLTFEGPPGTGGLFIREGRELSPFILGGEEQGSARAGAVSAFQLEALARWAQEAMAFRDHLCTEVARLRDQFEMCLEGGLFTQQRRLPHLSTHLFPGVVSESLLYMLNRRGVTGASLGGNRLQHLVHILTACGIGKPEAHCGLSFQLRRETTEEEVLCTAERTLEIVHHLRRLSDGLR